MVTFKLINISFSASVLMLIKHYNIWIIIVYNQVLSNFVLVLFLNIKLIFLKEKSLVNSCSNKEIKILNFSFTDAFINNLLSKILFMTLALNQFHVETLRMCLLICCYFNGQTILFLFLFFLFSHGCWWQIFGCVSLTPWQTKFQREQKTSMLWALGWKDFDTKFSPFTE